MSSLWTPGGEVPVNRGSDTDDAGPAGAEGAPPPPGSGGEPSEEEIRAAYDQMQRQLIETPAADVVAREAVAIYELAALHLSQPIPRLPEARLAIDAVTGLLDAVGDRLGPAGDQLKAALPQLRLAYVERADQGSGTAASSDSGESVDDDQPTSAQRHPPDDPDD